MYSFKIIIYLLFLISCCLFSSKFSDRVYEKIENIYHPKKSDYQLIENYLHYGARNYTKRLDPWQYKEKARNIALLSKKNQKIQHEIIAVNCDLEKKENCIILYTSFNFNYPNCLLKLVEFIKESDFVGHVIYRIGGWPNIEGGDLTLCHLPYAFKLCAFNEAYRLGFKRALWLDAPMEPKISLNLIFNKIKEDGIFTYDSGINMYEHSPYKLDVYKALGITEQEADSFYSINIGILGIDFSHAMAKKIYEQWNYKTKNREELSFSLRPEQSLFSSILNKYYPRETFKKFNDHINTKDGENLEFTYDKKRVQPNWPF